MRTIIAGSRWYERYDLFIDMMRFDLPWPVTTVISGAARGADQLGERWAKQFSVPLERYPAQWRRADGSTDKGAGHRRNSLMAAKADALLALWDFNSPGTRHMIGEARKRGLAVHLIRI
ncbi:MAG: SLOG family protein [Pseudomonadota bacterium]